MPIPLSRKFLALSAFAATLGVVAIAAHGQTPAVAPVPVAYAPSFSDLMNIAIQPRHTKLAMAVRASNWTYAAYEVRELRNAFARIARTSPQYEGQDTATLITMAKAPIDRLEAAIKANNAVEASQAFAAVTDSCNVCHTMIKRPYIAIVTPAASVFPNQDFSAKPGQ